MATRKTTTEDFTTAPQAVTEADVNGQDARTRLWQSLSYAYGNQTKKSDESYDKAISQSYLDAMRRGMQRSSFALQTGANLLNKKSEAQREIGDALIAAYQSGVNTIEQQEKEDERWERQFAANREDAEFNKEMEREKFSYGKERDLIADEQWQKTYDEQLRQFNEQMAYQRERANVSDAQWEKEYAERLRQFNEQMAEQRRQFDLNYNEDVRRYELNRAEAAAASGGGGRGGDNGPNYNVDEDEEEQDDDVSRFWLRAAALTSSAKTNAYSSAKKILNGRANRS